MGPAHSQEVLLPCEQWTRELAPLGSRARRRRLEARGRQVEVSMQRDARAVDEGIGHRDVGGDPLEPVTLEREVPKCGRGRGQRQHAGAVVGHEPGKRWRIRAERPPGPGGMLDHADLDSL